jgi:hypothetical protein
MVMVRILRLSLLTLDTILLGLCAGLLMSLPRSSFLPGGEKGDFSPHEQRSTFYHDPALLEQAALFDSCGCPAAGSNLHH